MSAEEQSMLEYYVSSGAYGTIQNYVVNEVNKNGKKKSVMNFFFKPLADLQGEYPVLEKVPVLLPVIWVIRFIKAVGIKEKRVRAIAKIKSFFSLPAS